jgi:hypothetical protein
MLRACSRAALILLLSGTCLAAEVGRIEHASGAGFILRDGQSVPITPGTILQLNDIVRTQPGALLRLALNDGSALTIGESTELRVAQFDTEQQQTLVEILHGRVRAEIAPYTKPAGRFVLKTPTAMVMALGTTVELRTSPPVGTVSQELVNQLPGPRGDLLSLPQTALTVGTLIKPRKEVYSPVPTSLVDLQPGAMPGGLGQMWLGDYPLGDTYVTALDHSVVTSSVNPHVSGLKFLLPGQSADVAWGKAPADWLGDPTAKDKLRFWGGFGRSDVGIGTGGSAMAIGDFDAAGRPCQPGVVVNGQPVATGGPAPSFQYKVLGTGTSTGNALRVSVTNRGTCALYFLVPAGTIMHPKGFTERVITGIVLGDAMSLKDFQKMIAFGLFIRVTASAASASAPPVAPAVGEATVNMRSYCVELHKLAPHPKTEYKFGDEGDQTKLGVNLPVLERALQLWRTGKIDLKGQAVDSVIQWALWARIEKMDENEFTKAYMNLVRKNYESQKKKWDKAAETRMQSSGQDLWNLVRVVLQ